MRRPRWITAGLLVSLICGFGYAITGPFRPTRAQINRYVPAFYLQQDLRDADRATVDAAWAELQDRISHKQLSSSFAAALLQESMNRQADRSITWEPVYGNIVEEFRAAGMVSDAQWALYARRSFVLTSTVASPVPVGGIMGLRLGLEARTGNQDRLGLCTMVYTEPRLESKHLLLNTEALGQNPMTPKATPYSEAASNNGISMLNGYRNEAAPYTAVAGRVRFQLPVRIAVVDPTSPRRDGVPAPVSEPLPDGLKHFAPHFEMYAKAPHDTVYRILAEWWEPVDVEFDVVEAATLEKDPSASRAVDDRMREALRSITIELDRSGRRCGGTAEDPRWSADIMISALPMNACFDVLLVD
ncbi:MAG: hypothetical protein NTV94_05285, partial [Planctomycetota bacterium]|nr:hypothetical protein [Planctomycetota bacterium]